MKTSVVHCVIPVHNRMELTRKCVDLLWSQDYDAIKIIIVDDGSTDGTAEMLQSMACDNLTVLKGDGNLWWGGSMRIGMQYVIDNAAPEDYFLMLNDDVSFDKHYVKNMLEESVSNKGAVIGSIQKDEITGDVLGCGYLIRFFELRFIAKARCDELEVDALPGRGVMFPVYALNRVGVINSKSFPHYLSDLEYTSRLKEAGFEIFISQKAAIYTSSVSSDYETSSKSFYTRYFSSMSKDNVLIKIKFFTLRGPKLLRATVVFRYPVFIILRGLNKILNRRFNRA